jgi:alpha-glucuronidase
MRKWLLFILLSNLLLQVDAEDGYKLWLRYAPISDPHQKENIQEIFDNVFITGNSSTFQAIKNELAKAGQGFINQLPMFANQFSKTTSLIITSKRKLPFDVNNVVNKKINALGNEGFMIDRLEHNQKNYLTIVANTSVGALYGTFHLFRLMQTGNLVESLPVIEIPKMNRRILNHWDNLDRTIERGYAGFSIWDWHKLPDYISPRYIDYARANASISINGTVLTSVNANAFALTPQYIEKVAALADVLRPYGLKVYLTARFSAPAEIGGLSTADPLMPEVAKWWKDKANEIYKAVPDFGGFLVKANSEGQPGPQDYGRSHAEGANMLAEAVAPHDGIIMWRAFVYSHEAPEDRAKQANNEFEPLDGSFLDNVFVQVKNGPIDFQPREPFHPLFGAMPQTPLALEVQLTQEYLGQATHLVYLAPLFEECLRSDTYAAGKGSTVAKIVDGTIYNMDKSAIAGVSNIGTDRNWTGHHFGQANWYAFGRQAWNHQLASEEIAQEWIHQTFSYKPDKIAIIKDIMMQSREAAVNYMTPLGLHHIMGWNHHYGPAPWIEEGRPDWTSVYYHKANSSGIGFDRTASGSDALSQYAPEIEKKFSDPETCPDKYLLWFHHLPWDYTMKSGNSLWDELCMKYDQGVKSVGNMKRLWLSVEDAIDQERFQHVKTFIEIQENEARWWKDACLLYFQTFSNMPFPEDIEPPKGELEEYMQLQFPYAPGIKPSW